MRRLIPVFLAAFLSSFASASPLPLGPERPLSPITPAPAPGARSHPSVAVDAAGHALAVWSDNRRRSDICPTCTDIYGSRLDESGKPLDPFGIRIHDGAVLPQVVSSGNGFLLLYTEQAGVWSLRLDANGHAIDTPKLIGAGYASVAAAASNGRNFLVALQQNNAITATILDLSGQLQTLIALPAAQQTTSPQAQIAIGGGFYHLVRQNGGATEDISIDDNGVTATRILGSNKSQWSRASVAANAAGMLVAWVSDVTDALPNEFVEYAFFDWNGGSTDRKQLASMSSSYAPTENVPLVVWDGSRFLVTWQQVVNGRMQIVGERMSGTGVALDSAPIPIGAVSDGGSYASGVSAAQFPDAANLVVWSDFSEVWSLALPSAGAIGMATAQRVSDSGALQTNLQIAGTTAVWMETSGAGVAVLASSAGGPPQVVAPSGSQDLRVSPAVASNSAMSLVAWIELTDRLRIMARRISASGTMLDAQPIVVADESWPGPEIPGMDNALSVATDGAGFLLVWANGAEVHAARMGADGRVLDGSPITVAGFGGSYKNVYVTRTAWTGTGWVVAIAVETSSGLLISPAPFDDSIFLARITSDGLALDTDAPIAVFDAGWASAPVSIAFADGRLAVAWSWKSVSVSNGASECGYVRLFDAQLVPVAGAARRLFCGGPGTLLDLGVAANGSSFLIVTSEQSNDFQFRARGRRIDVNGNPIDSAPFELSPPGQIVTGAVVSGGAGSLVVGYTRETPEAGDVGRIFLRTITAPQRSRAVR